jgi:hypothetical protein
MTGKAKNGIAWAKYVAFLWLAFAAAKALFSLGYPDPARQVVEALILAIAGPVITGIPAFALGWLFGKNKLSQEE